MMYAVFGLFCLLLVSSPALSAQGNRDWDFFIFSQRWTVTFCNFNKCSRTPPTGLFTIHGLWPSVWPHQEPAHCASSEPFDEQKLKTIIPELEIRWPDMTATRDSHRFWKHEWDKHGRCALEQGDLIKTQLDYFKTALNLNKQLSLLEKLTNSGIHPNDGMVIKTADVANSLKEALGVSPLLYCLKHHHKSCQLMEVRICLNRSLDLIDCAPQMNAQFNPDLLSTLDRSTTIPCMDQIIFPDTVAQSDL